MIKTKQGILTKLSLIFLLEFYLMGKKSLAGVGVACLIILGVPIAASAAVETVLDTPSSPPIQVDNITIIRDFTVTDSGAVQNVTLMVDFATHDGENCAVTPGTDSTYSGELAIALRSPLGTEVKLVQSYTDGPTYTVYSAYADRFQVTFDDAASVVVGSTNGGAPESGTFRGAESLSAFNGEDASGVWQVSFADTVESDVKCYYGAELVVETALLSAAAPVLNASVLAVEVGDSVLLTATLPTDATGTVEFFSGSDSLGSAPLVGGVAGLPYAFTVDGTYAITATYSGDTNYQSLSSNVVNIVVSATPVITPPTPPVRVETAAP